jgi:hypothetical protein
VGDPFDSHDLGQEALFSLSSRFAGRPLCHNHLRNVMSIIIVDYPLPESTTHRIEYEGKFLQLRWRGQEYFVFAPLTLHRYHNQLLAHFLADHAIPHRWLPQERLQIDEPELTVGGGGRFHVNTLTETLLLWDNSQAYGRFEESGVSAKIAAAGHLWSGYEVKIT